ncbi:MAG TPA: winged helix-turn-helix domain-containing protein [Nitrososphaerales archaeon]|nr:winged helix-turn-helix domain-containing protein [Nitrososphaerales archaeon]
MFEDTQRATGRRSKLEITCDILNVISKGNEKPTRIMQLANVTWDDLIMYLEALIRNQLLSRQVEGKRVTYSLTPRGTSILEHYLALKKEAAPLSLEKITKERISKALTYLPTIGVKEADRYAVLEKRVRTEDGAKVLSPKLVGKSGAVHTLGLVVQRRDGSKHGYVILPSVDETQVMKLFVTQLDTELSVHALFSGELSPSVESLAGAYSLDLQPWEEGAAKQDKEGRVDVLRFAGKIVLLEVDPAMSYETIAKQFASAFKASGAAVFAFTWKGGPIYSALASAGGVQIFAMTSQTAYPKPSGNPGETLVPQEDQAVFLDLTAKELQAHSNRKELMIFDSVSDLLVSLGFERTYAFLKAQKELLAREPSTTALFVVKRDAQDDRVLSLVRGLFTVHASYGDEGLKVTRDT